MGLIITSEGKLHLQAIGNTEPQEVTNRQELAVSLQFADAALIDIDTDTVDLKLKLSHDSSGLAANVTLTRVSTSAVYVAFLNLSTSVLNAITGVASAWMECTWLLGGKLQRSDPRQVNVRQSLTTGEEGAPEADQTLAARADWLATNILGDGETIEVTSDPLTGKITLTVIGGTGTSEVAWADITGKPTEFTPAAHTHNIYVRGSLTADSGAIRVFNAAGSSTIGYIPLVAEWPGES